MRRDFTFPFLVIVHRHFQERKALPSTVCCFIISLHFYSILHTQVLHTIAQCGNYY